MNKNKDIKISPSKGISIVIKNDVQQPAPIPKKKRKYKRKNNADLLKMPTIPSFIPAGDVSYIKPQYSTSSLNRNIIFPGVPQSLPQIPPPPPLPQITPPPPIPQIMPPPQQPFNISFDNMFGGMLESMMPREYGYKKQSYEVDMLDDDIMDALQPDQQDKYIEKKIKPQIEQQIQDIEFDNEEDKIKISKEIVSKTTARRIGTIQANKLWPFDVRYKDNEYYKESYINKLQDIITQDKIKTRSGDKTNTTQNKEKAKELLKAIGIDIPEPEPAPAAAGPAKTNKKGK